MSRPSPPVTRHLIRTRPGAVRTATKRSGETHRRRRFVARGRHARLAAGRRGEVPEEKLIESLWIYRDRDDFLFFRFFFIYTGLPAPGVRLARQHGKREKLIFFTVEISRSSNSVSTAALFICARETKRTIKNSFPWADIHDIIITSRLHVYIRGLYYGAASV